MVRNHGGGRRGASTVRVQVGRWLGIGLIGISAAITAPAAGARDVNSASDASFESTTIDLRQHWGPARACLVWQQRETVACFRTVEEMHREAARLEDGTSASLAPRSSTCASWFELYEDTFGSGRTLQFRDRGYWQNLSSWGFDNATSSYRTGACSVTLAAGAYGGGSWYPGDTSTYQYESTLIFGWNDVISSIRIS